VDRRDKSGSFAHFAPLRETFLKIANPKSKIPSHRADLYVPFDVRQSDGHQRRNAYQCDAAHDPKNHAKAPFIMTRSFLNSSVPRFQKFSSFHDLTYSPVRIIYTKAAAPPS
jgi:hypothetical protein